MIPQKQLGWLTGLTTWFVSGFFALKLVTVLIAAAGMSAALSPPLFKAASVDRLEARLKMLRMIEYNLQAGKPVSVQPVMRFTEIDMFDNFIKITRPLGLLPAIGEYREMVYPFYSTVYFRGLDAAYAHDQPELHSRIETGEQFIQQHKARLNGLLADWEQQAKWLFIAALAAGAGALLLPIVLAIILGRWTARKAASWPWVLRASLWIKYVTVALVLFIVVETGIGIQVAWMAIGQQSVLSNL